MSSSRQPVIKTFKTNTDLSSKQYTFVKLDTDRQYVVAAGAGEVAVGILMNAPTSGEPAEVALPGGGGLLKLGGTVSALGEIKSNASGQGVAASTTNHVDAIAQNDGVSGDVIEVYVTSYYKV